MNDKGSNDLLWTLKSVEILQRIFNVKSLSK